jgi:lysophospholipase L1-like esterase
MPQNPGFYDSSKIMRLSSTVPRYPENIPNGRNESYVGVPVSINSFGLRGPEISVPKPPHTVRIVGVGDSITFGYGIAEEETFLSLLQTKLNRTSGGEVRYEVVNAGVEGTGLDYYYHFLTTNAPKLQPDIVLVNLCLNDIAIYSDSGGKPERTVGSSTDRVVRGASDFLLKHSQLYIALYMRLKSVLYGLGLLDINKIQGYNFLPLEPSSSGQEKAWKSSFQILSRIAELARRDHYRLLIVVFPMEMQLSADALRLYRDQFHVRLGVESQSGEPQKRILEFGDELGIQVVDLLPAFRTVDSGKLYLRNKVISLDPIHPSPLGNRIAADQIFKSLECGEFTGPTRVAIPEQACNVILSSRQ